MKQNKREFMKLVAGGAAAAGLGVNGINTAGAASPPKQKPPHGDLRVKVKQKSGNEVHWIKPGPRRLSEYTFGTTENPQFGSDHIAHKISQLEKGALSAFSAERQQAVADLLTDFPVPVGWPDGARTERSDGYQQTKMPLPFSDEFIGSKDDDGSALDGELRLTYVDRQGYREGEEQDEIDLDIWFTGPDGTRYEVDVHHLERYSPVHLHGGGVMTNVYMHGSTGIGTPLMPTQFAFGSFWAIADLKIDGEVTGEQNRDRSLHMMTTQNVRDAEYQLAVDEELPLDEPYEGRPTHTHLFLPPIKETDDGPANIPLTDVGQPFIHFMFDEETVKIQ